MFVYVKLNPAGAYQQISRDEDSAGSGSELSHYHISLLLVHVSMLKIQHQCY